MMHTIQSIRPYIAASLLLLLIAFGIFWQVKNFDFVKYDDDRYVTENRHVQAGFSGDGVSWAFRTFHANNWHPLTWLSHMMDVQLYGLNPSGHHLTNLFLHALNTLLLFFVLTKMTGFLWRSFFVASLFAVHPLHVESVAWIAERKDVLSTLFWMLTIVAYIRYKERPVFPRYLPVILFFILGLLSKPMLVTLPFVLILLDYWPLGQLPYPGVNSENHSKSSNGIVHGERVASFWGLILEKVPLFFLSGISIVLTLYAQWSGIAPLESLPFSSRVANAFVSYIAYVGKMFWPQNLAVLYPYAERVPVWHAVGAVLILSLITFVAVRGMRRYSYLIVGWLWYVGTLVPVIGLVQVGEQSMADRYTYVPMIGLFLMIAWGVPDILSRHRFSRIALPVMAVSVIGALMITTGFQLQYWKNSMTLFSHTLRVTKNNFVIHNNMGALLAQNNNLPEAVIHYREALKIKPDDADTHYNLANALARQGDLEGAVFHYSEVLRIRPGEASAHNNMGIALSLKGRTEEAIAHFREALKINPDFADARLNLKAVRIKQEMAKRAVTVISALPPADPDSAEGQLQQGMVLFQKGKIDDSIPYFREALRLNPRLYAAYVSLGFAMVHKRELDRAIEYFRKALEIKPDLANVHNSLGVALAYRGALDDAISHYEKALRIDPNFAKAHSNLGVALAQKGKKEEAIRHLREALRIEPGYEDAKRNLKIIEGNQGK